MKRREIIKKGTLAGAAILLPAGGALAATGEMARHRSVISALSAYSSRVLPNLNKEGVHLLVSIDRMKAFTGALHQALPYEYMRAEGNVLSFELEGSHYQVENVLPQHFNGRARELG